MKATPTPNSGKDQSLIAVASKFFWALGCISETNRRATLQKRNKGRLTDGDEGGVQLMLIFVSKI